MRFYLSDGVENSEAGTARRTTKPKAARRPRPEAGHREKGQLKIGDHWNAITIIALSQSNPLKAVAEFVENSIDARASKIFIYRGKEAGHHYLRIVDDGVGIPKDESGKPDFRYVATHICDSIKRQLKSHGGIGIQGEFGIGLLSFWTVGEEMILRSAGADGSIYQMSMKKGNPSYTVVESRALLAQKGTELTIRPLLPGLKQLSGEKLQWYLGSELRNRILESGVEIRIVDRASRSEFKVEPRKFSGRRLSLPTLINYAGREVARLEIYLSEPKAENRLGLYRLGTRVLESITELEEFQGEPWNSAYLQGMIDAPRLSLTPGTRLGVIRDDTYGEFCEALRSVGNVIQAEIENQRRAEEERASRNTLLSIHRAFKEAWLGLPPEEYDWFEVDSKANSRVQKVSDTDQASEGASTQTDPVGDVALGRSSEASGIEEVSITQPAFFEFPGPLFSARISPSSTLVPVGQDRALHAIARDRKGKQVHEGLTYSWELIEGAGQLGVTAGEIVTFTAPSEPGLARIRVRVEQSDVRCEAEATLTVTDSLLSKRISEPRPAQGLPGYTYHKAPGEQWRSRFDTGRNLIVINNGHRDFIFASRQGGLKLKYLSRLYAKELVQANFPGASAGELMERLIEISLRVEEKL